MIFKLREGKDPRVKIQIAPKKSEDQPCGPHTSANPSTDVPLTRQDSAYHSIKDFRDEMSGGYRYSCL